MLDRVSPPLPLSLGGRGADTRSDHQTYTPASDLGSRTDLPLVVTQEPCDPSAGSLRQHSALAMPFPLTKSVPPGEAGLPLSLTGRLLTPALSRPLQRWCWSSIQHGTKCRPSCSPLTISRVVGLVALLHLIPGRIKRGNTTVVLVMHSPSWAEGGRRESGLSLVTRILRSTASTPWHWQHNSLHCPSYKDLRETEG